MKIRHMMPYTTNIKDDKVFYCFLQNCDWGVSGRIEAMGFFNPKGFINTVSDFLGIDQHHILYIAYTSHLILCWRASIMRIISYEILLHYVADWDIILLAGNEAALIPIQGCSSFHIVIAGEHLWTPTQHRKTPVFYCAEPGQCLSGAANPYLAEKGAERTWQDRCIL